MEHVITTYGGGEAFTQIFNAIASITGNAGFFTNLIHITLVVSAFYTLVLMLYRQQIEEGARWFFWVLLVTTILLLPKGTIYIHDPLSKTKNKVDNVPLVLGMFASSVSQVGKHITENLEAVFTLPDYLPYHKTGTVFASSLMQQLRHFRITDPEYKGNMERFVNQCIVYDAMIGHKYTLKELQNSPDIWKLVSEKASPVLGFLYKEGNDPGIIVTCKEGAQKLNTKWKEALTLAALHYGGRVNGQTLSKSAFFSHLSSSYQMLTGIAQDAESLLRQEILINTIEEASNNKLSELGQAGHYAAAKSLLQQRSTYAIAGEIAAKTLPLFKTVIEALSYALFLFIMILALLPNGHRVVLTYCGILLWTQLWAPLYAVLNLIMSLYGKSESISLVGQEGITMISSSALVNAHADITTLAAWLSISIPFLSYGLITQGAGAFVGMAQYLGSAMQSAASSTAAETVSGNLSLSNVSLGTQAYQNRSAFQDNTSPSYSNSQFDYMGTDGARQSTFASGAQSFQDQGLSQLGIEVVASTNEQKALQQSLTSAQSLEQRWGETYGKAQESALQNTASFMKHMANEASSGKDFGQDLTTNERQSLQRVQQLSERLIAEKGYTENKAFDVIAGASLGLGGGGGISLGGKVGGDFKSTAARSKDFKDAESYAHDNNYSKDIDTVKALSQRISEGERDSKSTQLAKGVNSSLNELESARQEYSFAKSNVDTLSHELSSTKSSEISTSRNVTQDILEYIAHSPVSNSAIPGDIVGCPHARFIMQKGGQEFEHYLDNYKAARPEIEGISINGMKGAHASMDNKYQQLSSEAAREYTPQKAYQKIESAVEKQAQNAGIDKNTIPSYGLKKEFKEVYEGSETKIAGGAKEQAQQGQGIKQAVDESAQKNLAWEAGGNAISSTMGGVSSTIDGTADIIFNAGKSVSNTLGSIKGAFTNNEVTSESSSITKQEKHSPSSFPMEQKNLAREGGRNASNAVSHQAGFTDAPVTSESEVKQSSPSVMTREASSSEARRCTPQNQRHNARKDPAALTDEKSNSPSPSQIKQKR